MGLFLSSEVSSLLPGRVCANGPDLSHTIERRLELARKQDFEARSPLALLTLFVSRASWPPIVRTNFQALATADLWKLKRLYDPAVSHAIKSSSACRDLRTASARTVASSRKPSARSASGITSSGSTT